MSRNGVIAFLPWIHAREPMEFGLLRLIPYKRGTLPGDLPHMSQADIDGVLGAYQARPLNQIRKATLLEFGDWQTGQSADDIVAMNLFRARDLIAMAALSRRRLFARGEYVNSAAFALTVQRFEAGRPEVFVFQTRRRDGGASHLWSSDEFAFQCPHQVSPEEHLHLDEDLLNGLMRVPADESRIFEAVNEFISANTDAQEIPQHAEIVMTKSAFEFLLTPKNVTADELSKAIRTALGPFPQIAFAGPCVELWQKKYPKSPDALDTWAREFCIVRGSSAHGQSRQSSRFVWPIESHLALAAILFPLLLKVRLSALGVYELTERDAARLSHLSGFIAHEPFAPYKGGTMIRPGEHPWEKVEMAALDSYIARRLYSNMNGSG